MRPNFAVQLLLALPGLAPTVLANPNPNPEYEVYTTTWVSAETETYTSTVTVVKTTATADCVPQNDDQTACGSICCAADQDCAYAGQCTAKTTTLATTTTTAAAAAGNGSGKTIITTIHGVVTTEYSAPYRITSTATTTETGGAEATGETSKDSTGTSLSGGAIAGIVIGTIVGIALLAALCFCCIARGLWGALFGRRSSANSSSYYGRSRNSVDIIEDYESYSGSDDYYSNAGGHRGRSAAMAAAAGAAAGAAARRSSRRRSDRRASGQNEKARKKSSGAGWLGLGAMAGTMLAMMNMKKDKRAPRESESMYESTYFESDVQSGAGRRRSRSIPAAGRSGVSAATYTTRDTRTTSRTRDSRRSRSSRSHSSRSRDSRSRDSRSRSRSRHSRSYSRH